jgi:Cu/Ag efflux protein CusF
MRIPAWRLALTGASILILAAVGVGLVAASSNTPAAPASELVNVPVASPSASGDTARHPGLRKLLGRVGPAARHFVNGTLNYVDKDGDIVTVQLDHGTIASIGSGSMTITEAGGRQVTVSTDADTVVRLGGGAGLGKLSDLRAGDEVFVQSRVDGSSTLAKHVLRVPAKAASTTGG